MINAIGIRGVVVEETNLFVKFSDVPINYLPIDGDSECLFISYNVYSEICVVTKEGLRIEPILKSTPLQILQQNPLLRSQGRDELWFSFLVTALEADRFTDLELCVFFKLSAEQLLECKKIIIDIVVEVFND